MAILAFDLQYRTHFCTETSPKGTSIYKKQFDHQTIKKLCFSFYLWFILFWRISEPMKLTFCGLFQASERSGNFGDRRKLSQRRRENPCRIRPALFVPQEFGPPVTRACHDGRHDGQPGENKKSGNHSIVFRPGVDFINVKSCARRHFAL